jgi:hypothetical protein
VRNLIDSASAEDDDAGREIALIYSDPTGLKKSNFASLHLF